MASGSKPIVKNWPQDIKYLTRPTLSKKLSQIILGPLGFNEKPGPRFATSPSENVAIKKITEPSHPALGEYGLFATKNLPPGSHILDYLGHYHETTPEDTDEASNYDLVLTRDVGGTGRGVAIDARFAGNEARMVNDYRGIAAKPNAEFKEREAGIMGVYVVVNNGIKGFKGVKKGDEILLSYGRSFWNERKE
ncbi:hypothetical protein H072_3679 [Dactylellina haptotyla CBS 200.50]|uniref:SET domain-containing protein n=1 Tax=Dactylellina haptotyla (strain CBS 200.50) TaxID=1284197 RepID=S8AHN1_DACHA|nr:hypothetical protein H072_3679 [Dactylellina haptotyla CBS 200.50]